MSTATMANMAQALTESMTPKFAVSYLRVSTRGQAERGGGHDEGFSIPAQREANKKKAASLGAMVGKEFVDRGASAKSADRPQLQAMLEYVKENADRVDYVIVHKIDRLARNRDDDSDIMRTLRECGIQLVSASESIDETPAGMLLHGIMSSIAEFYSQNLATEVKKGMGEKIKGGGTVSRAPLGYQNVRYVDEKGREERTVILDPDRAPLVKMAFEAYATEQWTVNSLAEYLGACGLTTRATPKIPSKSIPFQSLQKILTNPYYKGIVKYKGVEYPGSHEPIIDTETWDKVQLILASRVNGERTNKHPHYLKSTIYCAYCGERMIVSNEKKKDGTVYPYFVCAGRHSKRRRDCKTKYILIAAVEREIEKLYDCIQISDDLKTQIEEQLQKVVEAEKQKYDTEIEGLYGRKHELEHKREKLMEAHYMDAIPADFMKSEQQKITKELSAVEHEIRQHSLTFEQITENLSCALEMLNDCGKSYRNASDKIKRLMNQAIFSKIYVIANEEIPLGIKGEFRPPFDSILAPTIGEQSETNITPTSEDSTVAKSRILLEPGCDHSADNSMFMRSYSNFFKDKSSSNKLLVGLSQLYSNIFVKVVKYKQSHPISDTTSIKISITDRKAENNYGETEIHSICQKQKILSKDEIQKIISKYQAGSSTYELAKEFGCHRYTISKALKDNNIQVSNQVAKKKVLAEMIMQMYAEWYKPKEIGEALGVSPDTVRRILHQNNVYIRKSWEYSKK